ncbi:MAG: nucleotide exchange factor GrpE, partial [Armatimonadetes bacterium]|nr:nucleotide exchange factor GrpE [Armatimonadota bacterium]
VDEVLDKRLAHAAQAFRDVEKRLENEYERRIEAMLMTAIEVVDRLTVLADTARSSDDPAERQERLSSCAWPRDRLSRLLEESGVRAFASTGEPYDPHRHEVVRREHLAECEHEYVLQELRPGYIRTDTEHTLVRAKVIVAAPPVVEGSADG